MYSKYAAFQIHQQKKKERKAEKTCFNFQFHFSALTFTPCRYSARLKLSAAYTHGQIIDAKLTNQSARFTYVVLYFEQLILNLLQQPRFFLSYFLLCERKYIIIKNNGHSDNFWIIKYVVLLDILILACIFAILHTYNVQRINFRFYFFFQ